MSDSTSEIMFFYFLSFLEQFDYEEIMNTEFVGMKPPVVLRDELSVKHEELRKKSPQKLHPNLPDPIIGNFETNPSSQPEDEVLFIDVQNGKFSFTNE